MAEEHDDDLDVGSLRSVLSSMREADEEPPATGLAALMAAATLHAPSTQAKQPWWHVFRQTPVLALASIAVLIGGALVIARPDAQPDTQIEKAVPSAAPTVPPAASVTTPIEAPRDEQRSKQETPPPPTKQPAPVHTHRVPAVTGTTRGPVPATEMAPKADESDEASQMLLDQLTTKASDAAQRGDCESAKAISARVAAKDATYYRDHVASSPVIAKCF